MQRMKSEIEILTEKLNMLKSVLRQRKQIDTYATFKLTENKEIFYDDGIVLFGSTNLDNINLQETIETSVYNFRCVQKQIFIPKSYEERGLCLLGDYKRIQNAKKIIKVSLTKNEAKQILKTNKQLYCIPLQIFCAYHNGYIATANGNTIKRDKVSDFGNEDFMISAEMMALFAKFANKGFEGELHLDEDNKVVLVKCKDFFIVSRESCRCVGNYAIWFDNYDTQKQHIATFENAEELYNNTKPKYPQSYCDQRMIDETIDVSLYKIKEILKAEKQTKITLDKHTDNENHTIIVLNGDYIIKRL